MRGPRSGEAPSALFGRTVGDVLDRLLTDDNAIHTRHLALWLEPLFTVPALQARRLRITFEVERRPAEAFLHAYPGRFDQVTAAAMVGAVMDAAQSALGSTLQSEDSLEDARAAYAARSSSSYAASVPRTTRPRNRNLPPPFARRIISRNNRAHPKCAHPKYTDFASGVSAAAR